MGDILVQYIRFQEIAGALDSSLMTTAIAPVQNSHSNEGNSLDLTLKQSVTLLESLRTCWKEDVLVLSCSDKFLRLSLQLLSRSDCIIASFCISLNLIILKYIYLYVWLLIGTQLGCLLDWQLAKWVVVQDQTPAASGLLLQAQKISFMYAP